MNKSILFVCVKFTIVFILALSGFVSAQVSSERIDPNFNPILTGGLANVAAIAVQPDGKIIVGGMFFHSNFESRNSLTRLNSNGSVDTTFSPPAFLGGADGAVITDIIVLNDNRILVSGNFRTTTPARYQSIIRLNPDGSIDTSFVDPFSGTISSGGQHIGDMELQQDGKILIAGSFFDSRNPQSGGFARLNSNGSYDTSFVSGALNGGVGSIKVQPDGKIIIAGGFTSYGSAARNRIARLNIDASLDTTFLNNLAGANHLVNAVELQPDGKILIGGFFTSVNGATRNRIARLNFDGSLDSTFQNNLSGANHPVGAFARQSDGKILIGGIFTSVNGTNANKLARLNDDGSLDTSFASDFGNSINDFIWTIKFTADGKILVGGFFNSVNQTVRQNLVQLNADGTVDQSFALVLFDSPGTINRIVRQADGKILFVGNFAYVNGVLSHKIGRVNADGSPDRTFSAGSLISASNFGVYDVLPLPDGKIFIIGAFHIDQYNFFLRLNPDGSLDTTLSLQLSGGTFGGSIGAMELLPDGKILIAGDFTNVNGVQRNGLARLNPDFSLDTTFLNNLQGVGGGTASEILLSGDKILVGGSFTQINGVARNRIARLNSDGSLDATFQASVTGTSLVSVSVIREQPDGKILIGGNFTNVNGVARGNTARLNSDGSLDGSFLNNLSGTNQALFDIVVQRDGKIVIVGGFNTFNGEARQRFARLNPDGTVDNRFFNLPAATAVFVEPNGNLIIGGSFGKVNETIRSGLFRIVKASQQFDYDGDGRADISVFRPSSGAWYISRSSNNSFFGTNFGQQGDLIAPADFDGDGKTDISVFRQGFWYRINSSSNQFFGQQFGVAEDIPVPADFDGDGRADVAVFRPSNGMWYRINSSNNQFVAFKWGTLGDKPLVGDFDGDGKSDYAVFRPSAGAWYILRSTDNSFYGINFGISEDIPTPADFDADGKTDISVFRPSAGSWYRINSSNNQFFGQQFGISEDKPVAADYDGDGRADLAVFRPSLGSWYIQRSTSGFSAQQFGSKGDVPTPFSFGQ